MIKNCEEKSPIRSSNADFRFSVTTIDVMKLGKKVKIVVGGVVIPTGTVASLVTGGITETPGVAQGDIPEVNLVVGEHDLPTDGENPHDPWHHGIIRHYACDPKPDHPNRVCLIVYHYPQNRCVACTLQFVAQYSEPYHKKKLMSEHDVHVTHLCTSRTCEKRVRGGLLNTTTVLFVDLVLH
ncbi:hypothetical protein CEXT_106421 [Caerostris extrusa]|uniref:Uncharacterized protein n=1 Tax=Caerostris extrusa TaxID=172846 RepID=A0AAV4NPS4_CAEEX|nr:hypothetical protein CEXT_106421 [Caerostris extrusa]